MAMKFLFHLFSGDFQFVNVASTTTTTTVDNRILLNSSGSLLMNNGSYILHN